MENQNGIVANTTFLRPNIKALYVTESVENSRGDWRLYQNAAS